MAPLGHSVASCHALWSLSSVFQRSIRCFPDSNLIARRNTLQFPFFTMLSRSFKLQQVWWQPQLISGAALPSSNQNILRRLFADDALDPSEKVVLKTRDEAAKGAETWDETKGSVKETANKSGAKLKSAVDNVKDHAQREINASRDMVKDIPTKTKETAQGLKEVGVEAAKAVKREAERLAEKVGMKEKKPGDLDKTES